MLREGEKVLRMKNDKSGSKHVGMQVGSSRELPVRNKDAKDLE